MDRPTLIVVAIFAAIFLFLAIRSGLGDMQNLLAYAVLCGAGAFMSIGLVNTFNIGKQNYQDSKQAGENLHRFFEQLISRNFQRLDTDRSQAELNPLLKRYYTHTHKRTIELKATSAIKGTAHSFPAYIMITYEKIDIFGTSPGAGNHASPSEFNGILATVQMPKHFSGESRIYKLDSDSAQENSFRLRAHRIESGLSQPFRDTFMVRSSNKSFQLPVPVQELLLQNSGLFFSNQGTTLVLDDKGWGYASGLYSEETTLNQLADFQQNLTAALAK